MTAIVAIVGEAAHIATDGAHYSRDDHLPRHFAAKTVTMPHLPAALAISGPTWLLHFLGNVLHTEAADLDELMASRAVAILAESAPAANMPLRAVIAGHSRQHGPAAWAMEGGRCHRIEAGQCYVAPHVPKWTPNAALDREPAEFVASIVDLIGRQRKGFPIGGFVSLTTIKPDRIEQRILHRWQDRIGECVGQEGGQAIFTGRT